MGTESVDPIEDGPISENSGKDRRYGAWANVSTSQQACVCSDGASHFYCLPWGLALAQSLLLSAHGNTNGVPLSPPPTRPHQCPVP